MLKEIELFVYNITCFIIAYFLSQYIHVAYIFGIGMLLGYLEGLIVCKGK